MGNARSNNQDQNTLLQPEHSKRVLSIEEFWANVGLAQHYAVKRNNLGITYFHHFIISEVSQFPKLIKVIHYTGTSKTLLRSASSILGIVTEDVLERDSSGSRTLLDVEVGLYLIDDPSYHHLVNPRKAIERARQRLGENKYDPLINNCEHFVRWALTEVPSSQQIDCASASHKLAGAYLSELKLFIYRVENGALRALLLGLLAGFEKLIRGGLPRLFQHTAGATRGATAAMGSATFGLSLFFEILFIIWSTLNNYSLCKEGKIDPHNFKTAVGKDVFTALLSIAASTAGAVLGQILIPISLLGGVVGGALGGLAAQSFAPLLFQLTVSSFSDFTTWFSALSDKIGSMLTEMSFTKVTWKC